MDKVIVITGCAQGIGRAIAEAYLFNHDIVFGIDKEVCSLEGIHHYVGDLSSDIEREYFVETIFEKVDHIDVIINNAMEYHAGILSALDIKGFRNALEVGVVAPFHLVALLKEGMSLGSSIINIVSTRAFQTQKNNEAYASAKGALNSLTIALANSLGPTIRVNAIAPGWINTKQEELSKEDINQHPLHRVGEVKDIVDAVKFLSSEEAKFITGQTLIIDGGMSKQMIYHNDEGWIYTK